MYFLYQVTKEKFNQKQGDDKKIGTPESSARLSFTKLHGHIQLNLTFLFWFNVEKNVQLSVSHKSISLKKTDQ